MKKKESKFRDLPQPTRNVFTLGSLAFEDTRLEGGSSRRDFSMYSANLPLARDFVAALQRHVRIAKISRIGSMQAYFCCVREFLSYCADIGASSDMRMKDITNEVLREYQAHLVVITAERKAERRRRKYGDLIRLLTAGRRLELWGNNVPPPRNFRSVDDGDKTEPYMSSELADLEATFQKSINDTYTRIEHGKALLSQGINPRGQKTRVNVKASMTASDKHWNQLPNLLWYVVNVLNGEYKKHEELKDHSSFKRAASGGWGGQYRLVHIYGHLYPLNTDMLAFLNALEKKLGLNETSVIELKRDCLRPKSGNQYILRYIKRRGANVRYEKLVEDDGPYSGVAIIRILLSLTAPLVRFAEEPHKDWLFLCLTVGAHNSAPVKPFDACYGRYLVNRTGGWAEQQGLKDQHGEPMKLHSRALRTSKLDRSYHETGNYKTAMRQGAHKRGQTTVRNYLNSKSNAKTHDLAVVAGINSAIAVSKPTVIAENDAAIAAQKLSVSVTIASKILRGEQDVFFASCRDFRNRPGGPEDTPCEEPWGCLSCANAIITIHVLPRLLAFKNFMLKEKESLSPEEWKAKFGASLELINNDILPRFNSVTIRHSEQQAANERLYIPIYFRT